MTGTEDGRLGRVEGILEEVRTRLQNLGDRVNSLESRLDNRISCLESRMETRFYWLLGVMITMWVNYHSDHPPPRVRFCWKRVRMKVIYDPKTDTLTIRFREVHISEGDELQDGMIADLDAEGKIVGLVILNASEQVTEPQNMVFQSMGHSSAD